MAAIELVVTPCGLHHQLTIVRGTDGGMIDGSEVFPERDRVVTKCADGSTVSWTMQGSARARRAVTKVIGSVLD
jgi:hypothetical protein